MAAKKTIKKIAEVKASASAKATADKPAKKAVAKKTVVKKVAVAKAPVKKVVAKKAVAKKAPAKKAAAKTTVTKEQFYSMVTEAAYFAAQNDGNKKGSTDYWMESEAAVSKKFNIK